MLCQKSLGLDDWLTEVHHEERSTLKYQTFEGKGLQAHIRYVFARKAKQTLFRLPHRTLPVILIPYTEITSDL
jgi:hypothetical protein